MRVYFREKERHIFVDTLITEFRIELDHLGELIQHLAELYVKDRYLCLNKVNSSGLFSVYEKTVNTFWICCHNLAQTLITQGAFRCVKACVKLRADSLGDGDIFYVIKRLRQILTTNNKL